MFEWALNWLNENVMYEWGEMNSLKFYVMYEDFKKAMLEEREKRGMEKLKDDGVCFCRQAMVKYRKINRDCVIEFR